MKIAVSTTVLQGLLKPAIAAADPSHEAVLGNVRLSAENGILRLAATDRTTSVLTQTDAVKIEESGVALFPARILMEIAQQAGAGDLTIAVSKGAGNLRLGRTEWNLRLPAPSSFPKLPVPEDLIFQSLNAKDFLTRLTVVRKAAPEDTLRMNLMMVDVREECMRACDSLRLLQVPAPGYPDMSLPLYGLPDLIRLLRDAGPEDIEVAQDDNTLVFRFGDDLLMIQKMAFGFPDISHLILKPAMLNDQAVTLSRAELLKALRRVRITADPATAAVVLALDYEELMLVTKDGAGAWTREFIESSWEGPARSLAVNYRHLLDILALSDAETVTFLLGKAEKTRPCPILFKDDDGYLGVITQIRVTYEVH